MTLGSTIGLGVATNYAKDTTDILLNYLKNRDLRQYELKQIKELLENFKKNYIENNKNSKIDYEKFHNYINSDEFYKNIYLCILNEKNIYDLISIAKSKLNDDGEDVEIFICSVKNIVEHSLKNTSNVFERYRTEKVINEIHLVKEQIIDSIEMIGTEKMTEIDKSISEMQSEINELFKKKSLELFSQCTGKLANVIDNDTSLSVNDDLYGMEYLGIKLYKWLIGKGDFLNRRDIEILIKEQNVDNDSYLYSKYIATIKFHQFKFDEALKLYQNALEIGNNDVLDDWIKYDLLINCRNLQHNINRKTIFYSSEYQNTINNIDTIYFMPVIDKFTSQMYEYVFKEEVFWDCIETSSFANSYNFKDALIQLESRLFFSVMIGSYTQISETKRLLGNILYKYSKIHDKKKYLYYAIRIYIETENSARLDKLLKVHFDEIKTYAVSDIDIIWNNVYTRYNEVDENKIYIVFKYFWDYFSDETFEIYEDQLYAITKNNVKNGFNVYILNALSIAGTRLTPTKFIELLIWLLENKITDSKFNELFLILERNKSFKDITEELKINFLNAILANLKDLLNNERATVMISLLVNIYGENFNILLKKYEELSEKGIIEVSDLHASLLKANLGEATLLEAIQESLIRAKEKFEESRRTGECILHLGTPLDDIKRFIAVELTVDIQNYIKTDIIPFCEEVLRFQGNLFMKDECIDLLYDFKLYDNEIDLNFIKEIRFMKPTKVEEYFGNVSSLKLQIKLCMLKYVIEKKYESELTIIIIKLNKCDYNEKIGIIESINFYLKYIDKYSVELNQFLAITLINLFSEEKFSHYIIEGIIYLHKDDFFETIIEEVINRTIIHGNNRTKYKLVRLLYEENIINKDFSIQIIEKLSKDSSFIIRENALNILKNMQLSNSHQNAIQNDI